jgi:hypothetical protein
MSLGPFREYKAQRAKWRDAWRILHEEQNPPDAEHSNCGQYVEGASLGARGEIHDAQRMKGTSPSRVIRAFAWYGIQAPRWEVQSLINSLVFAEGEVHVCHCHHRNRSRQERLCCSWCGCQRQPRAGAARLAQSKAVSRSGIRTSAFGHEQS